MIKIYCDKDYERDMFVETLIDFEYCPHKQKTGTSSIKDVFDKDGEWIDEEYVCDFKGNCPECLKTNCIFLNGEEK